MTTSGLARQPDIARALVAASRRLDVPSKTYLHRAGEPERLGLVIRGLMRVARVTRQGKELTLGWARPEALVTTLELVEPGFDLYVQAVTSSVWCDFDVRVVRRLLQTDAEAGWSAVAIAEARMRYLVEQLTVFAYGDLRTRLKWTLLELACKGPGETLVAEVTQSELATGVAAARQSVAKCLSELRDAGVVSASRRGFTILRPEALAPEADRPS